MRSARYAIGMLCVLAAIICLKVRSGMNATPRAAVAAPEPATPIHREWPDEPPALRPQTAAAPIASQGSIASPTTWQRGEYVSIQINVDPTGANIPGDAANEPSIAVDPTDPSRLVVGWRQFNSVSSNFREAGWAYSHDAGRTWYFPGVLRPGEFSSDPVVRADADGVFHYLSLQSQRGPGLWACYLYSSYDAGVTWARDRYAYGGDKAWLAVDRTDGIGRGNVYLAWRLSDESCCGGAIFTRSTDGGDSFDTPIDPNIVPRWGTLDVGPDGALYVAGAEAATLFVGRSDTAQDPAAAVTFELRTSVNVGGVPANGAGPNEGGLLGAVQIATDHSGTATNGNVYLLASVDPAGDDPLDVVFTRSTDRGATWSPPITVNDDPPGTNAWQWFAAMSVAPNGRIDVIFNDTRNAAGGYTSELYYAYSTDGGVTFSPNVPVSPPFDPTIGYPQQNKIGDYNDITSDNFGANVAYTATFNGEQDVYYLRIGPTDCNANGIPDPDDIAANTSTDCEPNGLPDECEPDCNGNGIADACDILSGFSEDCAGNRIPDECEADCNGDGVVDSCEVIGDSDGDGLDDCADACPDVAAVPACVCPTYGECCLDTFCFDIDRQSCIDSGGVPTCQEPACCNGCLFGNADQDDDVDLLDASVLQTCFSGPGELPGFVAPSADCLMRFDADCDGDVDRDDYPLLHPMTGP